MTDETESLEVTPPPDGGNSAPGASATATATAGSRGNEDLSKEIARTVARGAAEQVTCRRVADNHYRCNWWTPQDTAGYDNPSMRGSLVTTSRISKSQFLHATRTGGKLIVREITR
jgi:hypothetical protein